MQRHRLLLPDLGFGDEPVTAGLWLIKEGRQVVEGEPLLEVVVGPAVVDLPAPASGVLIQAIVSEDEPLETGQLLGVIESG